MPKNEKNNLPGTQPMNLPSQTRTEALRSCMKWFAKPKVQSDEELKERTIQFFEECLSSGEVLTWEKYCMAIGYSRSSVNCWLHGQKGASPERVDFIKKTKDLMAAYDAELAVTGKINPVSYIFRAKNYYGMKDQQDVIVAPNNPLDEISDPEQLRKKYELATGQTTIPADFSDFQENEQEK